MTNMWQQLVIDYPWLAWIGQNYEWVFSGIGVFAIGLFFKKLAGVSQKAKVMGNGTIIQAGKNVITVVNQDGFK